MKKWLCVFLFLPGFSWTLAGESLQNQVQERVFSLPLNNPGILPAREASHMRSSDWVVATRVAGHARAYPWWILTHYHVVNDTINGEPVYLALCEACSGASAFSPIAGDRVLDFIICGLGKGTYEVCDLQTRSRWHPFAGFAVQGPLKGKQMKRLPVYQVQWADWVRLHPETTAVSGTPELRERPHGKGSFFGQKGTSKRLRATLHVFDERLAESELVFGLFKGAGQRAKAYPLGSIRKAGGIVQDDFDGQPVVLILNGESRAGAYLRELDGSILSLQPVSRDPHRFQDQSGTLWDEWGEARSGPLRGRRLEPANGYVTEWYEWVNNFPNTELYGRRR